MNNESRVELGDELLAKILDTVRSSDLPIARKITSLIRAGKVGEMYIGAMADDTANAALTSALADPGSFPKE